MRPHQPTASWLLRWLLVVVTLAGVGLVQSTHCTTGPHETSLAAAAGHHHESPAAGQHRTTSRPADTTAGHCDVNAPIAEPAVRAGVVTLPAMTACADTSAPAAALPLIALRAPAVTLTQIGISRI